MNGPNQAQQINLSHMNGHAGDMSIDKNEEGTQLVLSEVDIEIRNQQSNHQQCNQSDLKSINEEMKAKEELDETKKEFKSQSSQQSSSLILSGIELVPEDNKWIEFIKNIIFLLLLYLLGPLLTTYVIYKYDASRDIPLNVKVKTIIQITVKAFTLSFTLWIMLITLFQLVFGQEDISNTKDFHYYYKIEFIINIITIVLVTFGGAILGKKGLFNNKFFSELYYLSQQKSKKNISATKFKSSDLFKTIKTKLFSKGCCEPQIEIEHPLDMSESTQIYKNLKREKKIQERMSKVMKQLFIDSQTFTFKLLPFSLSNALEVKIQASCHQSNKEVLEDQQEDGKQIVFECPQVAQRSRKMFRRLQTIKFQEINLNMNDSPNLQGQEEQQQEIKKDDDDEVKINGRKLCSELLLFCEKQESLKPQYFKSIIFSLFILFKGILPCIFRVYDGLSFFGDNILIGITCQLNRQLSYAVLIGFLLFSIDLDIMNGFTQMTNKLIDYSHYLDQSPPIDSIKPQKIPDSPVSIQKKKQKKIYQENEVKSINLDKNNIDVPSYQNHIGNNYPKQKDKQ